ncbi:MAG: DUF1573 domain-containing protein [Ignavibacteriae bacterium]|nr:DUF1573 domain-containing protein [Ignavibacteriota bacterium]
MKFKHICVSILIAAFASIQFVPAGESANEKYTDLILNDTIYPAEIEIKPQIIQLDFYPNEFITKDITLLNRGGQTLEIKKTKASCYCANAAVINFSIPPFGLGKVRLSFNTQKLTDSIQRIDYTIWSNARDSVFTFPVYLRRVERDSSIQTINHLNVL